MWLPLVALAVLTVGGGLLGAAIAGLPEPVLPRLLLPAVGGHHGAFNLPLALVATAVALAGLGAAWLAYGARRAIDPARVAAAVPWAYRTLWRKLYVDELYTLVFVRPFRAAAGFLWRVVDDDLVDGAVNAAGRLAAALGQAARRWQTGNVRQYALSMLLGAVAVAVYFFLAAR